MKENAMGYGFCEKFYQVETENSNVSVQMFRDETGEVSKG